ncbi:MAG: dynamin family protein [Planctomycetota bacterium]
MGEVTMFIEAIDAQNLQQEMEAIHNGLHSLYTSVTNDHKEKIICAGYSDYVGQTPMAFLNRAAAKLAKQSYKIGIAGGFSAGKSTSTNALLGEPNMLPANIGETTMSITVLQKPKPGVETEHVEVQYFTKEQALRHVFENNRYELILKDYKENVFKEYTHDVAIKTIKEAIAKLAAATDVETRKKRKELEDFIQALAKYDDRLGTLFMDKVEKSQQYLTVDNEGKGLGHLLLIEQVYVYKNNPLFVKSGIEIIDLPGTDSVNVRQKEITHEYLSQADAVLLIVEPRGFAAGNLEIQNELKKHNNEVRNKMFTIMNCADKIPVSDISKPGEIARLHEQIVDTIVRLGLDPGKFYMTSAKYVELKLKKEKGQATEIEINDLAEMERSNTEKLKALGQQIPPDWLPLMKQLYKDGGIDNFKRDLMRYLERDIRIERMKEIFSDIKKVYATTEMLLEPEYPRVRDLLQTLKNKRVVVTDFIDKLKNAFYDAVGFVHERVEAAVEMGIAKGKEKLDTGITSWCDKFSFSRLRTRLAVPTEFNIKMETITQAKSDFAQKFPDIMVESVVRLITDRLHSQLLESKLSEILKHFSKSLGTDHLERYERILDTFTNNMKLFTEMRASEETWDILFADIRPRTFGAEWNQNIEADFRKDLKDTFVVKFTEYANKLTNILWRYYQRLIKNLMDAFDNLSEDLSEQIKMDPERVTLPVHLLTGGDEEDNEGEYKIAGYFQTFEGVKKRYEKVSALFATLNK